MLHKSPNTGTEVLFDGVFHLKDKTEKPGYKEGLIWKFCLFAFLPPPFYWLDGGLQVSCRLFLPPDAHPAAIDSSRPGRQGTSKGFQAEPCRTGFVTMKR